MAIANPDIGEIDCAWCGTVAPVRKNKNGKMYVMCPNCGQQPLNAQGGQEQILNRARLFGAPAAKPLPETPAPEQKPEPEPEPAKPAKGGFLSFLEDDE